MNRKEVLLLSIGVFLTVVAWLIADIYHASTEDKIKSRMSLPQVSQYKISKDLFETLKNKTE
ncbi:MAG: hypothetical protein UR42_C0005G0004 [Candidatus Roizmanbacteria bacterium GW2011_GWA2_33_33]|uniref:Uncharacterized protein n=2 Tax=Candidatus Roizmaniibacteriota TaxID=1752723 RepID=A0A0G0B0R3_9BACT|nr:MAG: hypothetical protein UR42_C0005G0004 [Candidatus Roizmanbacteria bacterium GW2011_GWA2_33_33]KKP63028.1 MAG: hypothetical protein UR56_C0002G0005 [Candidatus Roizmanbacteria bacterium GW2011_GWC2_34_23]